MLPSKLVLFPTYIERNINGKYVRIWKNCQISQKSINKNAMYLESLLELLEGDNECLILANQILGETMYFYTTWNIITGLI